MNEFKYNPDAKYREGGVYEPTHQFSLVNVAIQINERNNIKIVFPNIWKGYKLPPIEYSEQYDNWIENPMQFWQNQLNFAVWCATTGCGVSKKHLVHKNPMIRSFYRFHAYYQIRRILRELECPTPNKTEWEPLDNHINIGVYTDICSEFHIKTNDWRQKLDRSFGMGTMLYHASNMPRNPSLPKHKGKWGTGDWMPNEIRVQFFKEKHDISRKKVVRFFSWHGKLIPIPRYVDQLAQFFLEPNETKVKPDGTGLAAIGSFVLDEGKGFTRAGVGRINESIRTYVWAILGAQSQARVSIISNFDAQDQFLNNVETAINSEVDIPGSIKRYQDALGYARSKVDFVVGFDLYMMPSDMNLFIGKINGYNNLLLNASESDTTLVLGYNGEVNDLPPIKQDVLEEDAGIPEKAQGSVPPKKAPLTPIDQPSTDVIDQPSALTDAIELQGQEDLTHEERKWLLILGGGAAISFLIWFFE